MDPTSFGVDEDDESNSFQSLLVGDEIKTELEETSGIEVIELQDNDIQIIAPSTSDGNFYVSSFETEFDEPRNKVGNNLLR